MNNKSLIGDYMIKKIMINKIFIQLMKKMNNIEKYNFIFIMKRKFIKFIYGIFLKSI